MEATQKDVLKEIVRFNAQQFGLDPKLVGAIISTESAWRTNSARFEKRWSYYHRPDWFSRLNRITEDTEMAFQKTSWGLMQIMGGTARFIGFGGWIPDLCRPEVGVEWGCRFLKQLAKEYIVREDQIAAYNAGSVKRKADGTYVNQQYVDKVLSYLLLPQLPEQ